MLIQTRSLFNAEGQDTPDFSAYALQGVPNK